jgi:hypothetical protein
MVSKSLPGRVDADKTPESQSVRYSSKFNDMHDSYKPEHSGSDDMKPIMMARMLSGQCHVLVCMRCTKLASKVQASTMLTTIAARLLASESMTSSAVEFLLKPTAIIDSIVDDVFCCTFAYCMDGIARAAERRASFLEQGRVAMQLQRDRPLAPPAVLARKTIRHAPDL